MLDSAGNPAISYYDDTNDNLKVVRCDNALCNDENSIEMVDKTGGIHISLALDAANFSVISYYDDTNKNLKLARCSDRNCGAKNAGPTANAGGPYRGEEGHSIVLDGTQSNDPDDDPLKYYWIVKSPLVPSTMIPLPNQHSRVAIMAYSL